MINQTLEKAMEKLKNGDETAFDYIYDHTYKVIYFVVHNILKDRSLAEDITQDTYITAFNNRHSYKSNNLLAWLSTIAKRLAINEYNRRKRNIVTDFNEYASFYADDKKTPDEDSFGLIALAEKELSETDFQILIMSIVAGYKRREISIILNMPVSTVSFRYKQALAKLKKIKQGGV